MNPSVELHVGWHNLHPDPNLNYQLNRWAVWGGSSWLADVRPMLPALRGYHEWVDTFLVLGEHADAEGRMLEAALHFRSAEFFMPASDARRDALRRRLIPMLREAAGVDMSARQEVAFGDLQLPVWSFPADRPRGTAVVFGGFDSYIEDFFPLFLHMQENGSSVVAFEGPGQGSVLEEQHANMIPDWHRPVSAVLDATGLDDVTLIGVSLGGCLAIRAASFEPRVRRVVALGTLVDLFECVTREQSAPVGLALRGLLAVRAKKVIDQSALSFAHHQPVVEWGLARAMHVFGGARASEAIEATREYNTRDVSSHVRQDVLLLAGAEDHIVPHDQLWQQARLLTAARSVTARLFTAEEQAQAHCQIGNLPLALRVISSWAESMCAA